MRKSLADILKIDLTFAVFLSAVILLIPLRLALSWLFAVIVHEFSHYIALRLYGIEIYALRLQCFGVIMDTAPMTKRQEILCALAGPCGGFFITIFARWLPTVAICAFIQSIHNLIPIIPMDGGRALRCILIKIFGPSAGVKISTTVHYISSFLLCAMILYLSWKLELNLLIAFLIQLILFLALRRKLPCKQDQLIVQ